MMKSRVYLTGPIPAPRSKFRRGAGLTKAVVTADVTKAIVTAAVPAAAPFVVAAIAPALAPAAIALSAAVLPVVAVQVLGAYLGPAGAGEVLERASSALAVAS